MSILHNNKGLSRLEFFCIVGICLIAVFAAYKGILYYHNSMARGNDSLKVNAAKSVATMNLSTAGCVINGCEGSFDKPCKHMDKDGYTTGHYDAVKRKIFADNLAGYNEYTEMKIGDEIYKGKKNTMVIKVQGKEDKIYLSWVPSKDQERFARK